MRRFVYILGNNELFGCLEADLMRFYHIDLRDLFTQPRKITIRQVVTWMRHLPSDSALSRRGIAGDPIPSPSAFIQAASVNEIRLLRWLYTTAHSKTEPEQPEMIDLMPERGDTHG